MTQVPQEVIRWLERNYPKPRVDPSWVEACYEWIVSEKKIAPDPPSFTKLLEHVEDQLLKSELVDSMVHHTGLPEDISSGGATTTLSGPPLLVEMVALTDIGISAFQLEQVRAAREERVQAGVQPEDEGEEDGDLEIEGEGPIPKFPRGMLSFELCDGLTTLRAIEYRPLPQLSLEKTRLGYKLQLKNVRVVRGIAQLEPRNVILKGGYSDVDQLKGVKFKNNLRQRLGLQLEPLPDNEDVVEPAPTMAAPAQTGAARRSPPREFTPPLSPPLISRRNNDEDLEPRRRKVPSSSNTLSTSSQTQVATSTYFSTGNANHHTPNLSMSLSPTLRQTAPTLPSASPPGSDLDNDFALLDELESEATREENRPPPEPSSSSKSGHQARSENRDQEDIPENLLVRERSRFPHILAEAPSMDEKLKLAPAFKEQQSSQKENEKHLDQNSDTSDDYFGLDDIPLDSDAWKKIDDAEKQALSKLPHSQPSASGSTSMQRPTEIITIDDDDDDNDQMVIDAGADDKENIAVATRHVRRRTAETAPASSQRVRSKFGSQGPASQRRGNRPVILASDPADVFEISD